MMTELVLLTTEVNRLREENKLLLAYNKRLIIEQTELGDKLDNAIKAIGNLIEEKIQFNNEMHEMRLYYQTEIHNLKCSYEMRLRGIR